MAAPVLWYVNGLKALLSAGLALGTPKVMLLSDTYVLDQDAHDFVNDISAHEAAGTGYAAGGLTLAGVTTSATGATNTAAFDANDITGISVDCCYAVVYVDTGNPATSPILTIADLSEGEATDATWTGLTFNANGIAGITAA